MKNDVHFRSPSPFKELAVKSRKSRDRETSRISLRKVIHSLKFRKLIMKVKHVIRKSVPASSALHNIINGGKSDTLKGKLVSSVIIFFD